MSNITSSLTTYVFGLLTSDTGLKRYIFTGAGGESQSAPGGDGCAVFVQNAPPELVERSQTIRYPAIYVYCDRLTNTLKEKFATFSGTGRLVIEVRCSQDRIEGLQHRIERYTNAACRVLDNARGVWQDGAFYTGEYEVSFTTLKHGGKNFLQVAKISFEVQVSK